MDGFCLLYITYIKTIALAKLHTSLTIPLTILYRGSCSYNLQFSCYTELCKVNKMNP